MIYLDNNATTPVAPEVIQAMKPYWSERFQNPGSIAGDIEGIAQAIEGARISVARLIHADAAEVFFTSGATEANNWVLRSIADKALRETGTCHFVVSAIEHPSVLETARVLCQNYSGLSLDIVPVDREGLIIEDTLLQLITNETRLVSLIWANNESGVIQPIGSLSEKIKRLFPQCLTHTDATQAVGKIPVNLAADLSSVDLLSCSAHKFQGPKGIGALFVREGVELDAIITGGGQQENMRSGTESPALIVGMQTACDSIAKQDIETLGVETRRVCDSLESHFFRMYPGSIVISKNAPRLPNTTLIILPDTEGELAVYHLLNRGIVTSTGSACSSGSDTPSHVLLAMGIDFDQARNAVRLSLGMGQNIELSDLFKPEELMY